VIPIGLPSIEFVLIRLAFLLATVMWLGWSVALIVRAKSRQHLRGGWAISYVILTAVSTFTLWRLYDLQRHFYAYKAEQQARFYPTLTEAQRHGTIDMPARTELELGLPYQLDSFQVAIFPYPIPIRGVQSLRAERFISYHTDENYKTTGYTPGNIRLTGVEHSVQEGWICDARYPISFSTGQDGRLLDFQSCTLAAGNSIDGIDLPAGSEAIATTGTVYLNGYVDVDRWLIHLPPDLAILVNQESQTGGALLFDANRKLHRQVQ
jgi:hypothetical protein